MVNAPVRASAMDIAGTSVVGETSLLATLEAAGLAGWDVQKTPLWADTRNYSAAHRGVKVEGKYATMAKIGDEVRPLGIVGEQYGPVQNEQHADFMDAVVKESGGAYAQATAFKDGALVYVSIQLPEIITVGGVDPVKLYLNGINSHDGSTNFMLNLSPERAWCANQLTYFRRNALRFSHSGNVFEKLELAKRAVANALKQVEIFGAHAARLVTMPMNVGEFHRVVDEVFPMPAGPGEEGHKPRTWANYSKLREGIEGTLMSPANRDIAGTAWGGLNAVIEYLEWGHGADKGRAERIMTSKDLENKIAKTRDAFSAFALAA